MRIIVLFAIVGAIAVGAWAVVQSFAPQNGVSSGHMYQGSGETNLDLGSDDNILLLDLPSGRVSVQMRPDLAPKHVQRIKEMVKAGFYDGLAFHRVIDGFMAQGGDPNGTGTGGSGINLPGEFSKVKFERGVVGMARAQSVNSADSQFFIMLDRASWLDRKYTVWGEVIGGMEHVDALKKGDPKSGKISGEPDNIVRMQLKSSTQ